MDPAAALACAETALDAGELDDAAEFLASYRTWRRAGGFEPRWRSARPDGDHHAARLTERLGRMSVRLARPRGQR